MYGRLAKLNDIVKNEFERAKKKNNEPKNKPEPKIKIFSDNP